MAGQTTAARSKRRTSNAGTGATVPKGGRGGTATRPGAVATAGYTVPAEETGIAEVLVTVEGDPSAAVGQLKQMIEQARDERFKLLRIIQESNPSAQPEGGEAPDAAHAADGASVSPAGSRQKPVDQAGDRVTGDLAVRQRAVDTWFRQRLESFRATDQGIKDRLAQIARAEERLQCLVTELKSQLEQARPVARQLADVNKHLGQTIEAALSDARGRIEEALGTVDERLRVAQSAAADMERRLATHGETMEGATADAQNAVTGAVEAGRAALAAAVEPLEGQLTALLDGARQRMAQSLAEAEATFGQRLPALEQEAARAAERAAGQFDVHVTEAEAGLHQRLTMLDEQAGQGLARRLAAHEQACAEHLASGRQTMCSQLDELEASSSATIDNLLDRAGRRMRAAQAEAQAVFDSVCHALPERVEHLQREAEGLLDQADREMARRRALWTQGSEHDVETTQRQMAERMEQVRANARALMDLAEQQLRERIGSIEPRLQAMVNETEAALAERLESFRRQSTQQADQVEQRLAERLERLDHQGRGTLAEVTERIDDLRRGLGEQGAGSGDAADASALRQLAEQLARVQAALDDRIAARPAGPSPTIGPDTASAADARADDAPPQAAGGAVTPPVAPGTAKTARTDRAPGDEGAAEATDTGPVSTSVVRRDADVTVANGSRLLAHMKSAARRVMLGRRTDGTPAAAAAPDREPRHAATTGVSGPHVG